MKYKEKECRCWTNYPNEAFKKKNGEWKCEQYKCVLQGDGWKRKTRCVLKEETEDTENAPESVDTEDDRKPAGVIFDYFGRKYVADSVKLKAIDSNGVCSFYGFKEVKEDE